MLYKIEFEVAALFILLIMVLFHWNKRNLPNMSNRIFRMLMANIMTTTVLCIISTVTVSYPYDVDLMVNHIFNTLYLTCNNISPFLFYEYVLTLTEYTQSLYGFRRAKLTMSFIPFFISVFSVLSSPVTGLAYYFDENRVYTQGPMMVYMYGIALFYLLMALYYLFKYRRTVSKSRILACGIFVILVIAAVVLQLNLDKLLITDFACVCAGLIFYLLLQNPEESIDRNTGMFNRNAFFASVNELVKLNIRFRIVSVAPDNLNKINEEHGYDNGNSILREIADFLDNLMGDVSVYRLEGDNFALVFKKKDISSEALVEKIRERFMKPWHAEDREIYMTTCICCMSYPENADTVEEVINVIKYSVIDAKSKGDGTVIYARNRIMSSEMHISELELQRKNLKKKAEEAYRTQTQIEEADQAKNMFWANVSHEIRTPMNIIAGMTDLILKEKINETVRANALDIKSASASLINILNNIIDISRIESGKIEANEQPYQLSSMIHDVINTVSMKFINSEVEFFVEVNPKLPDNLIGDEMRLKQILINLLSNAYKFTQEGHIRLRINGTIVRDSIQLHCDIEDTGIGIREEDLAQLFNNFTRLNWKQTKNIEGTGLGLSICKKLVELMGGKVSVSSTYGKGSTFSFDIKQKIQHMYSLAMPEKMADSYRPLIYGDCCNKAEIIAQILQTVNINYGQADKSVEPDLLSGSTDYTCVFMDYDEYKTNQKISSCFENLPIIVIRKRNEPAIYGNNIVSLSAPLYCVNVVRALDNMILNDDELYSGVGFAIPEATALIIDDNEVNLRVAQGLLESYNIRCTTALGGPQSLDILKTERFDIIFMDHIMPGMDGIDTLQHMRNMNVKSIDDTPVIALTASVENGIKDVLLEAGFAGYISKPINIGQLEEILREFLGSKIVDGGKRQKDKQKITVPENLAIKGIDVAEGLRNCAGVVAKYIDLLEVAYESGMQKIDILNTAADNEDYEAYMVEVHALKSVAGILGAGTVRDMAAKQEAELRAGNHDFIHKQAGELIDAYQELLFDIGDYLKKKHKQSMIVQKKEISRDRLLELADRVKKYIEEYEDQTALEQLEIIAEYKIMDSDRAIIREAIAAIKLYDYDEVIKILKRLES